MSEEELHPADEAYAQAIQHLERVYGPGEMSGPRDGAKMMREIWKGRNSTDDNTEETQ